MKLLAALSGGVDSAVAAALAVEAGHEVTGVHLRLARASRLGQTADGGVRGCASPTDLADAEQVAAVLGIPFQVWDLADTFEELVVADFLAEYAAGRTPNPCVRCNQHIKWAALLDRASDFDAVVTGHYARLVAGEPVELHRAANLAKDQSYVLAVAGPQRLARAVFPLGDFQTKAQVRAAAARRRLAVSEKRDSYDICFIPDGDTAAFLRAHLGARPGPIVDVVGNQVGEHQGAYAFTVGQRKGLGLGHPAADGQPRYVLAVDVASNTVVVGDQSALATTRVVGKNPVWYVAPNAQPVALQVRAHGGAVPAMIRPVAPGVVEFELARALRAVAPGQSAVAYAGTRVIAQAEIAPS